MVLQQKHKIIQCLENQLTQHAIVCNCAKEGRYFCFWASDPHNAKLDSQSCKYQELLTSYHHHPTQMKQLKFKWQKGITNSEHCQGWMDQNKSWTACINSCNFCHSYSTSSDRKTRTTIILRIRATYECQWPCVISKQQRKISIERTLIVPPAMHNAPSFGITWKGNLAFSQYWQRKKKVERKKSCMMVGLKERKKITLWKNNFTL